MRKMKVSEFLNNYDEKSPSFRDGMKHHPYYFFTKIKTFLKKTNIF